ncbi:MAG: hypothetical protein PHQ60_16305 [Sideroxydans sp.]|nr:hypothetical protein [Sideroxydans sp.]
MKDYRKGVMAFIYIVMALITVYGALGYAADDYFKELKVNDATKAEAVFTLDNKAMLLTKEALTISFNEVCGKVNDYKILAKAECDKQIPIYSIREVCYDDTITDNKTLIKTIEKVCYDEQYISSYKTEYYECWKEAESIDYGIKDYKIDADISMAKCDDGTFGYKVDWMPAFNTLTDNIVYDKWAWWNESYGYKMPINCTHLDDFTPIVINGSNGFEINGEKQIVWTYCSGDGTALYYNNYSDYAVANDTTKLPFEVEFGNATSYNPTSVWDEHYDMVHHLEQATDSTSIDSTNINNMTANATVTQVAGKIGNAQDFDGDSGRFLTTTKGVRNTTAITIESWISRDNWKDTADMISRTQDYDWYVDTSADKVQFYVASSWVGYAFIPSAGQVENNTLYHFVFTYIQNGNTSIFFNGVRVGSWNCTTVMGTLPTTVSSMGATHGITGSRYFNGIIDEFRISKYFRSDSYITQVYNNAIGTSGYGDLGEIEEGDISHPPEFVNVALIPSEVGHCFAVEFMFNDTDNNVTEIYMNYSSGDCVLITFDSEGIIFYADFNCCGNPYEMNIFNATAIDEDNNSVTTDNFNWTYGNICPVLSPISGQTSWLNNLLNFTVNASDGDDDAITYYDNTSLFNITNAGQITHNTTNMIDIGIYSINITISDGYCNDSQVFNYEILLTEPVTISASPIPELDFTSLTSMVFLFILIFGYIGINILAFLFRSFAFVSLAFFIGIFIGFMLISFHAILGLAFIFLGIMVVMGFSRRR